MGTTHIMVYVYLLSQFKIIIKYQWKGEKVIMRKEEKMKAYISKHVYLYNARKKLDSSGRYLTPPEEGKILKCGNFIDMGIFRTFTNNNIELWQDIEMQAPYDEEESIRKLDEITTWNPGRKFAICKVLIHHIQKDVEDKVFDDEF